VSDAAQVEGERTRSAIAARTPLFSRKQKGALILIGAVAVCGWMVWSSGGARKPGHAEIVPPLRIGAPEAIAYPAAAPAAPASAMPAAPKPADADAIMPDKAVAGAAPNSTGHWAQP
jgi:hypothetical protein